MRRMMRVIPALGALALAGCGERSAESPAGGVGGAQWLLASEPSGAESITAVKAGAAEGDRVVLRGRIGGRRQPLTPGSLAFTLVDLSLPYCGQVAEDGCGTPWDYCCETPETINAHGATVQVVGADGAPLLGDASSAGLEPLDEVVVVGTVGPRPSEQVLMVMATGVYAAD